MDGSKQKDNGFFHADTRKENDDSFFLTEQALSKKARKNWVETLIHSTE